MKDASDTPRSFKKYHVTADELKEVLGIDWPGKILSIQNDYSVSGGFTITMYTQPHELRGTDRQRYTRDISIPVPAAAPVPPPPPTREGRWFHALRG